MSRSTAAQSAWWKSAVVYQVYPRSFADSDGDGIGDLRGIIEHLDHLADLGVDVIWLSPVYCSPQDDNGYDISDYQDIDPVFGTLADFDELIAATHALGMRLVMDLVVNHTSDEHAWFDESRSQAPGRTGSRGDFYIWRDPRSGHTGGAPGAEPNNWGSFFSGSAWEWEPARGQYYLHLFSRKQPDLNWENPQVRRAIHTMMRWWLDRGVDGFRMDVVNFLSKDPDLPDGTLLASGFGDGTPHFAYGPRIHDYLAEMKREVFDSRAGTFLTVGEMPAVTPEQALAFTDVEHGQLDMVFQFEHVDLDAGASKWDLRAASVPELRDSLSRWQAALGERGWNSLYWNNHDQPRVVSRFGDDREHWYASATALATVLHLQRGTPYIYQGEELGMTNVSFSDIADFRDIESLNHYASAVEDLGQDPEVVLESLRRKGRDNARTPMQWTAGPNAGFTEGEPWIPVNPNAASINAESQRGDPHSVYAWYQALIRLRHEEPVVVHGDFRLLDHEHPTLYAYSRTLEDRRIAVYANLGGQPLAVQHDPADDLALDSVEVVLANLSDGTASTYLPWEVRVLRNRAITS